MRRGNRTNRKKLRKRPNKNIQSMNKTSLKSKDNHKRKKTSAERRKRQIKRTLLLNQNKLTVLIRKNRSGDLNECNTCLSKTVKRAILL